MSTVRRPPAFVPFNSPYVYARSTMTTRPEQSDHLNATSSSGLSPAYTIGTVPHREGIRRVDRAHPRPRQGA